MSTSTDGTKYLYFIKYLTCTSVGVLHARPSSYRFEMARATPTLALTQDRGAQKIGRENERETHSINSLSPGQSMDKATFPSLDQAA